MEEREKRHVSYRGLNKFFDELRFRLVDHVRDRLIRCIVIVRRRRGCWCRYCWRWLRLIVRNRNGNELRLFGCIVVRIVSCGVIVTWTVGARSMTRMTSRTWTTAWAVHTGEIVHLRILNSFHWQRKGSPTVTLPRSCNFEGGKDQTRDVSYLKRPLLAERTYIRMWIHWIHRRTSRARVAKWSMIRWKSLIRCSGTSLLMHRSGIARWRRIAQKILTGVLTIDLITSIGVVRAWNGLLMKVGMLLFHHWCRIAAKENFTEAMILSFSLNDPSFSFTYLSEGALKTLPPYLSTEWLRMPVTCIFR